MRSYAKYLSLHFDNLSKFKYNAAVDNDDGDEIADETTKHFEKKVYNKTHASIFMLKRQYFYVKMQYFNDEMPEFLQ